jgi:glycosyltransferase involved in cell wall biosynthesis
MHHLKILISHAGVYKKAGWGRIFPLAVGLANNKNSVTIITTNPHFSIIIRRMVINDVNIIIFPEIVPARISGMGFGLLSLILKVLHVLLNKYDIVHSDNGHRPLSGIPCRLHKRIFNSVYVAEWYDWNGKGGQYDSKRKIFKIVLGWYELKYEIRDKEIADGVVVLSEMLRSRAEQLKPKDRIVKIHGGADVSSIPFLYDNSQLKTKFNISNDTLTFGYINAKNNSINEISPLLDAIRKYEIKPKVKILIFGDGSKILETVSDDLRENIVLFGWIDFVKDFEKLQCVDVFILFKEDSLVNISGWPNCIGDYLACGRPTLLNPVGEVVDFVNKYPFGFILSSKNVDDVYSKMIYISDNLSLLREKGKAIRNLAEEVVSWKRKSTELYDFYTYLLTSK